MKRISLFFLFTLLGLRWSPGQTADSSAYRFPLDLPPLLSATFGELRPGHFHAGLDIKTNGKTGYKVYAIADGYIYRVKVQRGGYGKAVYIKHHDGKISVYAHLSAFAGDLAGYVKRKQYEKQRFFIELRLNENLFPVTKGQVIGFSGNTGGSSGPHLHFELREDEAHPVNPMRFGFRVPDTLPPRLVDLWFYPLTDSSVVAEGNKPVQGVLEKQQGHDYRMQAITAYGAVGIGIRAYDRQNNTWNKNGLYRVSMFVNGIKTYETRMDRLDYGLNRRINLLIDYPRYVHEHVYVQRLWKHPLAKLPVFTQLVRHGIVQVEPGKTYRIRIELADFEGNTSNVHAWIIGRKPGKRFEKHPRTFEGEVVDVSWTKGADLGDDAVRVHIPRHCVYDSTRIALVEDYLSFDIGLPEIPLNRRFRAAYSLKDIPPAKKKYAYLARYSERKGRYYFATARRVRDSLILNTYNFGHYKVFFDSIPPVISGLNIRNGQWISRWRYLRFRVSDRQTGVASVEAFIDGRWILTDWDPKTGKAVYDFNDLGFDGSKHELLIRVKDRAGNTTEKKLIFYRKFK